MAQTSPLVASTAAGNSSDIVVTTPVKLVMFATTPPIRERCVMRILTKDPNGNYQNLMDKKGRLVVLSNREPDLILEGPGTYRVTKSASTTAIGVFADTAA